MTNETKKSDTELAIEFIERGQDALGQANITMLVRPDKLIEKIEQEIERARRQIEVLRAEINGVPGVDGKVMDRVEWQNEGGKNLEAKKAKFLKAKNTIYEKKGAILEAIKRARNGEGIPKEHPVYFGTDYQRVYERMEKYSSGEIEDLKRKKIAELEVELKSRKIDIEEAERNLQKAERELKEAEQDYERRKTDPKYYQEYAIKSGMEGDRKTEAVRTEIEKQEKRVEKMQEYISLLIEKAIGQIS